MVRKSRLGFLFIDHKLHSVGRLEILFSPIFLIYTKRIGKVPNNLVIEQKQYYSLRSNFCNNKIMVFDTRNFHQI